MSEHKGRRPTAERETPWLDSWMKVIEPELQERGAKMELARFLSRGDESKVHGFAVTIQRVLKREIIPNADFGFGMLAWLESKASPAKKK